MNAQVSAMAVYSGECLQAVCGQPAGFCDMNGKPLHTGDIVILFTVREHEDQCLDYFPNGLTAVVSDEWTSYSDGSRVRKDGDPDYFVMGIKTVPMDSPGRWRVIRVKEWHGAVLGEHWADYGFSYRSAPPELRHQSRHDVAIIGAAEATA